MIMDADEWWWMVMESGGRVCLHTLDSTAVILTEASKPLKR